MSQSSCCKLSPPLPSHNLLLTLTFQSALFAIHVIIAIQALMFGPEAGNTDDEIDSVHTTSKMNTPITPAREWEMVQIPPTPGTIGGMKSPVTPRTRAFNELE